MGFEDLLGAATGLVSNLASGNTSNLGAGIGTVGGGVAGTLLGGPLGGALGAAAGKAAGQGIQALATGGGGGGLPVAIPAVPVKTGSGLPLMLPVITPQNAAQVPPEVHDLVKTTLKAVDAAPEVQKAAAVLASMSKVPRVAPTVVKTAAKLGAPVGETAVAVAKVTDAVAKTTAARKAISDSIGKMLTQQSPQVVEALMSASGVKNGEKCTAGMLVRNLGVDQLARRAGLRNGLELIEILGLNPQDVVACGLDKSMAEHRRNMRNLPTAVVRLLQTINGRHIEAQLEGLFGDDDPPDPGPGRVPSNSVSGTIPQGGSSSGVSPGKVPIRAANWDFSSGNYALAWGDTLSGLALTYLGNAGRWGEIWKNQDPAMTMKYNPSQVPQGTVLRMPPEAVENAKKLVGNPGASVDPLGRVIDQFGERVGMSTEAKVALGVGGAAALAGIGYLVFRKPRR